MFTKSGANFSFSIAVIFCLILGFLQLKPVFDYDFEQFFPQDDENLAFYREYEEIFGSDNDYLLLAFENSHGRLFDASFLSELDQFQESVTSLERVDSVFSILTVKEPIISPFGVRERAALSWDLEKDEVSFQGDEKKYQGNLIAKDGESLLVLIKNEDNLSKEDGDHLYGEIQELWKSQGLAPKAVAGKIQTQGDFVDLMQNEFGLFFGTSLILMLLILVLIFRSWWGVVIPILVLLVGVLWAFALILLIGKKLALMSVMQPTIFLIVGLSALIHFFTHLIKALKVTQSKDEAISKVFKELWVPVTLTILTTSLGFFSLYFTSIPALKDFGLTTGLGILMMFFSVSLITPFLLYRWKKLSVSSDSEKIAPDFYHAALRQIFIKSKEILVLFFFISMLSVYLGSKIDINGYLLDNLPSDHPIQNDFNFFNEQFGGSNPLEIYLKSSNGSTNLLDYEALKEIDKLEMKLKKEFGEISVLSPVTLVKTLNQAQNQGDHAAFMFPSPGQFKRMERFLGRVSKNQGFLVLSEDLMEGRISARIPDLGSLQMSQIREIVREYIEEEINEDVIQVRWTGTSYLIDKGHESVTIQMARGLGVAFLLVGIIAGFLFKSWRISFILLIPNIIPLLWMLGLMYFLGVEFKLTTAILFTVAFGIAVDDSIHFMTRLKMELSNGKNLLYALKRTFLETGKAIVLTTLILVSGFAVLIFSRFGVTHYTGLLISSALVFALLADLILLPVILLPMKKVWEKKNGQD